MPAPSGPTGRHDDPSSWGNDRPAREHLVRLRRLLGFDVGDLSKALGAVLTVVVVGAASIAIALKVAPLQTVSAFGQTVQVGAAAPTLNFSGPGVLDLFGQSLETTVQFAGPVRPRLVLSRITVNRQVANVFAPRNKQASVRTLGRDLADGFTRYFIWELLIVAGAAAVLFGAIAGWRRFDRKRTLVLVVVGCLVVEAFNVGAVMYTTYSAPQVLSQVGSLDELVGRSPLTPLPAPVGPKVGDVEAVVIGDSTASGAGLPLVPNPTAVDRACARSVDSYASDLAHVNDWNVENLACSSATIEQGLLGPQQIGSVVVPAQLGLAKQITGESLLAVSIGADDMQWSALFKLCAVSAECNNQAATAFFQSNLAAFTQDYYDLLKELTGLPGKPQILINSYYDPFGPRSGCLASEGLTLTKIKVLRSQVDDLNAVLAKGAQVSGFTSVRPDFTGHQLCSPDPYVQGLGDPAPFHPNVAGALAIALADEKAIPQQRGAAR
ncbi:MAG: SGNH/GDSL hydrolase family protein [Acidimicrobiales bacterium]